MHCYHLVIMVRRLLCISLIRLTGCARIIINIVSLYMYTYLTAAGVQGANVSPVTGQYMDTVQHPTPAMVKLLTGIHIQLYLPIFLISIMIPAYPLPPHPIPVSMKMVGPVPELSTGRMDPRVGSGRVGSRFSRILAGRVGSGQIFVFFSILY